MSGETNHRDTEVTEAGIESEETRQVSVAAAARRMGVTPRNVLKLLHAGRLRGGKEGKSWRVEAASLDDLLAERTPGLPLHRAQAEERGPGEHSGSAARPPAKPPRSPERPSPAAAARPASPSPPIPPRPSRGKRGNDGTWDFAQLVAWERVYPVAIAVLRALDDPGDGAAQGLLRERARDATVSALTQLAQGYHSYHGRDKTSHYAQSREMLCSAACALSILAGLDTGRAQLWQQLADELQGEPLGSVTGLIRVTEGRKGQKQRDQPEARGDGA